MLGKKKIALTPPATRPFIGVAGLAQAGRNAFGTTVAPFGKATGIAQLDTKTVVGVVPESDPAYAGIAVEGDNRLFNQYGVMLVDPQRHPSVKKELGQQFIDWLVSAEGQKAIADYKINGEQLFYPNASDPGA